MREADDKVGDAPYCADDGKLQGRLKKSGEGIHDMGVCWMKGLIIET